MNEATFRKYVPNASKSMIEANKGLLGESVVPQGEQPAVPKGNTKFEKKNERELQGQIVNLLRLRGVEVLWHRTDKRSAATVGWPDLSWALKVTTKHAFGSSTETTYACAWEVKMPGGKLSPEQEALRPKLEANGWRYRVIRSVDEALAELKAMGVE